MDSSNSYFNYVPQHRQQCHSLALSPLVPSPTYLHVYVCMYVYVRRCGREGRGVVTRPRDETGSSYRGRGACYPVTMVTRAPVAMGMKHDTASWIDHITTTHRAVLRGGTFPSPGCNKLTTSTCLYSPLRDRMYAYSSRKKHTGGTVRSTVSVLFRFKNMAPTIGSMRKFRLPKLKKNGRKLGETRDLEPHLLGSLITLFKKIRIILRNW